MHGETKGAKAKGYTPLPQGAAYSTAVSYFSVPKLSPSPVGTPSPGQLGYACAGDVFHDGLSLI